MKQRHLERIDLSGQQLFREKGIGDALLSFAVADNELSSSTYSGDPSIEEQVAAGRIAAPPVGYEQD